jgi:2-polyprenyl-3-methyl-5-hydroxy-6-metoxy-1,4-benzoquinol methylase
MNTGNELENLEKIALDTWYGKGVNAVMVEYTYKIFSRFIKSGSILELGPAEGIMTERLVARMQPLTVIEGSLTFSSSLKERFPNITVVHSLFENYRPTEKFETIILGHVLEHVENPVDVLNLVKSWLTSDGIILAAVPNSRSLHRQAAVDMGLLAFEESMNEADIHHGHRRVFNPETFRNIFVQSGLKIEFFGGYWLKPVSNKQIEESWTTQMLEAFMRLGERYPDIAGDIYIVAKH